VSDPIRVTTEVLADHPLPDHGDTSSKPERGRVLLVGGTADTPGAVLLAGLGVLRAGAATVRVVTDREVARHLAIALPEALVAARATDPGDQVESLADDADCILIGPGTDAPEQSAAILPTVVKVASAGGATVVFDAGALDALDPASIEPIASRTVLMPNPVEVCRLMDVDLDDVQRDGRRVAVEAAAKYGCTVALRGAETWIASPGEPTYLDASGNAGLATSGSGDVLAGLLAGFAARGADPLAATLWAAHVHGVAGERCAEDLGPVGYLARELLDRVPAVTTALSRPAA
jgi:ADP-dependent NAD(P)H-hydrate dehydratase